MQRYWQDMAKNKQIYWMVLPIVLYYLIFKYVPMYGAIIAFKDFSPGKGIWHSSWVGMQHFQQFFNSIYFWRILRNTFLISLYTLLFGFPVPILLALMLNEVRMKLFKRFVQSVSYLPHFISLVVICGLIVDFAGRDGLVNTMMGWFGVRPSALLANPGNFRSIYVISEIWQRIGWESIIFLAAISGINPELYEAATVDGAGRFRKIWNITLPGLTPIIVILLILRVGGIMEVGFEKIILLYNPLTYATADVISSFVYREGLVTGLQYSYSTAIGLFQSAINFILLFGANALSRKLSDSNRLW